MGGSPSSLGWLAFLRPSPAKLALFLFLAFVCVAGAIQSYAFLDGEETGILSPPLYEELRGADFWVPWILLSLPLWALAAALCPILGGACDAILSSFPAMGTIKFPVASVIYSYVLSAWAVHSASRKDLPRGFWLAVGVASSLAAALISGLPSLLFYPELRSMAFSGWITTTIVFATYCTSGYGLWVAFREAAGSPGEGEEPKG